MDIFERMKARTDAEKAEYPRKTNLETQAKLARKILERVESGVPAVPSDMELLWELHQSLHAHDRSIPHQNQGDRIVYRPIDE